MVLAMEELDLREKELEISHEEWKYVCMLQMTKKRGVTCFLRGEPNKRKIFVHLDVAGSCVTQAILGLILASLDD